MLEFAVLGLLHDGPMHGYELKKRLNANLGAFRAFSYGSLYPTLNRMQAKGWITVDDSAAAQTLGARRRVTYTLTADGKEHFAELVADAGPSAWDDDGFGIRLAFFARTAPEARLLILEGRRSRLEEKREGLRSALARTRERLDTYTLELQQHGLESVERDVRWLNELIASERTAARRLEDGGDPPAAEGTGVPDRPGGEQPPTTS